MDRFDSIEIAVGEFVTLTGVCEDSRLAGLTLLKFELEVGSGQGFIEVGGSVGQGHQGHEGQQQGQRHFGVVFFVGC